jgi:hypothetical protein
MKSTMFVLALVFAAVVAGCQDANTIATAPAQGSEPLMKPAPVSYRVVPFSATIREPGQTFNSFIRVEGEVQYTMTILQRDPIPPSPQYVAVIDLVVKATLTELWGGGQGSVKFSNHQEIPLQLTVDGTNDEEGGSWNGSYIVRGLKDRFVLDLVHRVTRRGIELSDISLNLSNIDADHN